MAPLPVHRAVFPFFARCARLRSALWPLVPGSEFHAAPTHLEKAFPPRPKINEDDIEESFLKGSGPGGQKIVTPLLPNTRPGLMQPEQNIVGSSANTQAYWDCRQNPGYAVAVTKPQDCPRAACGTDRVSREGRRE